MKRQAVNLQWIYWMPMRWVMKEWLDTPQRNIQVFPHSLLPWNPTPPINTQLLSLKSLDFFREMDNFLGIKVRLFILMQMDVLLICKPLLSEGIIPFLIKFHNWIHKSVSSTLITLFHQWFLGHRFPMFLISYHGYALVITVLSNQELHFCGLQSIVRTNLHKALRINLVCLFLILFSWEWKNYRYRGNSGEEEWNKSAICLFIIKHLPLIFPRSKHFECNFSFGGTSLWGDWVWETISITAFLSWSCSSQHNLITCLHVCLLPPPNLAVMFLNVCVC